jgi:thiamine biosynthesis lipoprotein
MSPVPVAPAPTPEPGLGPLSRRELFSLRSRRGAEDAGFWARVHRLAMACRFEITLPGEDSRHIPAAREALDEIDRLEAALTVFRDTSEVAEVNRTAGDRPVEVGRHLRTLLERCQALHRETEGAFDVTSTPLSRCWGFLRRQGRLPAAGEIEAARASVGMKHVALDDRGVRFTRRGMEVNFNAIGKGYALDRITDLLRRRGVERALLSAGGSSLRAIGGGREGYAVDVRSARVTSGPLARLRMREAALGTSGASEQFFEAGGRRYGHVLDPRTGWPAEGVLSVSVAADDAATADALATAFLVGGAALAERYCAAHPRTMALVTEEADPDRMLVFGSHEGVTIERGAERPTAFPSPYVGRDRAGGR